MPEPGNVGPRPGYRGQATQDRSPYAAKRARLPCRNAVTLATSEPYRRDSDRPGEPRKTRAGDAPLGLHAGDLQRRAVSILDHDLVPVFASLRKSIRRSSRWNP